MQPLQAQAMAILIRINRAVEVAVAMDRPDVVAILDVIHITRINRKRHRHPGHRHPACCSNTKCICATHWRKEWTRSRTAYTHSKLFFHKVWKIWVISKLPDRPMCVNWCFTLSICFPSFSHFLKTKKKKIPKLNQKSVHQRNNILFRRIG
jgi:hypothetical protein